MLKMMNEGGKIVEKQYFGEIQQDPDYSDFSTFSDCPLNLRRRGR
jgi:hypothetical protein